MEKWEDCQTLCQLVDTCNFFNYGGYKVDQKQRCNLKYGLGRKVEVGVPLRRVFGRKYCKGEVLMLVQNVKNFVVVDCQMKSSSTSGLCEADCGSNNGTRKVFWSEKIVAEAMYGGKPCDKEESSWTTTELCTIDKAVICTGE